jgi:choline dehydrogenase-like flavoprotein
VSWWKEPKAGFEERARVVIVGSGAGGALAAVTLAEAGIEVVLVEAGFRHQAPDFPANVAGAVTTLFQEGGFRTMSGTPPIPLAGGETLGGSTVVNSAISFRTPELILKEWNELSGGVFSDTDDYYRAMDEVEAELHVGTTPDHLLSGLDRVHKEAAEELGWSNHNFRRNTPTCVGCGRCNTGCVVGGKNSVDRAFLPRAADAGARIYTGCEVDRVEPGLVTGSVLGRDRAVLGTFSVAAERVILSGGTVSTPRLLLDSGVVKKVGEVGRGLRCHPVFSVLGFTGDRRVVAPGASQGHYIDEFARDDIVLESNPTLVGAVFQQLPLHGMELMQLMARAGNFANTGAMIRDRSKGRVLPSRGAGARVHYSLDEVDRQRAIRAMRYASRLWLEGLNAEFVALNVYGAPVCRSMEEVDRVLMGDLPSNRLMGYSSHPQATCSVGRATDRMGQLRELPGVHAIDGSSLPSNVGRNPQISIMTVARVLSERVAESLGAPPKPLYRGDGAPTQCPQPGVACGVRSVPLAVVPG